MDLITYLKAMPWRDKQNYEVLASEIAYAIAKFLLDGLHGPQNRLPTQSDISYALEVPVSILKTVWDLLRDDYQLIKIKGRGGTIVLSEFTDEQRAVLVDKFSNYTAPSSDCFMDNEQIPKFSPDFEELLLQLSTCNDTMDLSECRLREPPELVAAFVNLMSKRKEYEFSNKELFYTDDHSQIITLCCEAFSRRKSTVAIIGRPFGDVIKAILTAKRNVKYLQDEEALEMLEDLEYNLKNKMQTIDIVLIGISSPYSLLFAFDDSICERLLNLQKAFGFKIILDDSFPGMVKVPNLFKWIKPGINNSIISINSLSLHRKLSEVRVVLAGQHEILALKKKMRARRKLIDPTLAYTLLNLIKQNRLDEYDPKLYARIENVSAAAMTSLLATEQFVDVHIRKHQGYFFYLELRSGRFPPNIHKKLRAQNICIMDRDNYRLQPQYSGGILISVAQFQTVEAVQRAIDKLIQALKSLLK